MRDTQPPAPWGFHLTDEEYERQLYDEDLYFDDWDYDLDPDDPDNPFPA